MPRPAEPNFCSLLPLACLFACHALLCADIIDRMAISVGNQVITESQIDEEVRVTAFLNNEKPDLSVEAKKKAADRLIDQALIKREMDLSRYPVPALSDADSAVKDIQSHYGGQAAFEHALQDHGITEAQLKEHLWWQLTVLRFVDYRFRPGIEISDSEVQAYYQQQVSKWEKQGVRPVPGMSEQRAEIEEILTERQIDQSLDQWLAESRKRVPIRYLDEALR
jgi:peptidyl-prolyl cis-trans isomerase SurA